MAADESPQSCTVFLAQIAAGLHLELERDLAPVGEAVDGADRDVDRLVLVHETSDPIVTSAVRAPPPIVRRDGGASEATACRRPDHDTLDVEELARSIES
jgi:hypothetical protein